MRGTAAEGANGRRWLAFCGRRHDVVRRAWSPRRGRFQGDAMPANSTFDPETLSIMGRALDEAWAEVESRSWVRAEPEKSGIRRALALRIMAAVRVGQRDPQRLRDVALHVIEGCKITRAVDAATTA